MNPLEKLQAFIESHESSPCCTLDAAETSAGASFLDVALGDFHLNVDWRRGGGFGLTAGRDAEYGEGADETFPDLPSVKRRVAWLIEHRAKTAPPLAEQLRRIRLKRHLTQAELAQRLGVKQSSVSKLESRGETVSLRKLQELVAAMGGRLSLRVSFGDPGDEEELSLGELDTAAHDVVDETEATSASA